MSLTRRAFAAASAALAATPAAARKGRRPLVIAHRGASGERPEHTLAAYRLAIEQGADFIEPDLVPTKDGHLVARHENEISGTTDVARRPEFADRRAEKVIDGERVTGWFTEDFTLAELKTLRARERLPHLRPASARFDGEETIPTYQEVVDLAKAESRRLKRTIGTYPEMKHPSYFQGIGLPLEARLAEALKANQLDSAEAPVFVQCFEAEPLKIFRRHSKARRVFLVGSGPGPAETMLTPDGLKEVATFAEGLGPEWSLVVPVVEDTLGIPSHLVEAAHAAGLLVHPWTVRAENAFLPPALRKPGGPAAHGHVDVLLNALLCERVDGLFSDSPRLAVSARNKGCVYVQEDRS